jgi:hypothetical protein
MNRTLKHGLFAVLLVATFLLAHFAVVKAQFTTAIQSGTVFQQGSTTAMATTAMQQQGTTTGGTTTIAPSTGVQLGTTSGVQQGGFQVGACTATEHNIHGQWWSSNIGWVYFNCGDIPVGGQVHFGVDEDSSGSWVGTAWSDSVGWIQFGGLTCPTSTTHPATGTTDCNVHNLLNGGTSDQIVGWARATDPTFAGNTGNTGGWDGWISMNGLNDQNPAVAQVQTSTLYKTTAAHTAVSGQRAITGFAWGSDDVGWLGFQSAYVDTTVPPPTALATIILTANPTQVLVGGTTTLTYSITPANAQYFTGASCTASAVPVSTVWNGSVSGLSATNLTRTISNVDVSSPSTTYTITCPVNNPTSSPLQTTATSNVVVSTTPGGVVLTAQDHNLCANGSVNSTQSTTLGWVTSPGQASYCRLSVDGALPLATHYPTTGSVTVPISPAVYSATSSSPYVTPSANDATHQTHRYSMQCYDSGNIALSSYVSNTEYVVVEPNTATAPLDCTQKSWQINMGTTNSLICVGDPATITWTAQPLTGPVPPQYTYAILLKTATNVAPTGSQLAVSQAINGTHTGLSDSFDVTTGGYYWVYYVTSGGTISTEHGGSVNIQPSLGATCPSRSFSGPNGLTPLCEAGSANTAFALPKSFTWTADASISSCTQDGVGSAATRSGTVTIPAGTPVGSTVSHIVTCNWTGPAQSVTHSPSYGPVLSSTNPFCMTPAPGMGVPIIKEQ